MAESDTPTASEQEAPVPETSDEGSFGSAAGVLGDALGQVVRVALQRGRSEMGKAAVTGRSRLALRQLRSDRDAMLRKVGLEVLRLVEAGEVQHPGLLRASARIAELDAEIADVELRRQRSEGEGE